MRLYINRIICIFILVLTISTKQDCTFDRTKPYYDNRIVVEHWYVGDIELESILRELIIDFELKNANYVIKAVRYDSYDELKEKIDIVISEETQPTTAQIQYDSFLKYFAEEKLVSLQKFLNDPTIGLDTSEQLNFIENFWNAGIIGETQYAMPFDNNTEIMYYNQDIFTKYQWEVPTTWEEVVTICEAWKLTPEYKELSKRYPDLVYPFGYNSEANTFITIAQQFGAKYISINNANKIVYNAFGDSEIDMLNSKLGLSWYKEQYTLGNMATLSAYGIEYGYDAFLNGQAIMMIGDVKDAEAYDGLKSKVEQFETGVSTVPQFDLENPQVVHHGDCLVLLNCKDTKTELGGWLWLKHLTSYESVLKFSTSTYSLPIRKDVTTSQAYLKYLSSENNSIIDNVQIMLLKSKKIALLQQDWYCKNILISNIPYINNEAENIVKSLLYSSDDIDIIYDNVYNKLKNK